MTPFDRESDAHHLDALCKRISRETTQEEREALLTFAELVARWGARTDLVAARSPEALIEVLFLDALILAEGVSGTTLVDVGAGAGAPSIPVAILRPELQVTLVEPRRKRVAFMRTAVGALGLSARVSVREARLEDLEGEHFDSALSRATFEPAEWLKRAEGLADRVVVLLGTGDAPAKSPVWERAYRTLKGGARKVAIFPA